METSTPEGLRQRRVHSSRPRHRAADAARHALRQGRALAGRRDPGDQRLRHRPARYRADARSFWRNRGSGRHGWTSAAPIPAHRPPGADAGRDAVAQRRARLLRQRRRRLHPRFQLRREDRAADQAGHRKARRRPPRRPGARPAQQSRRRAPGGAGDVSLFPASRAEDRHRARPPRPGKIGVGPVDATAVRFQAGDSGE